MSSGGTSPVWTKESFKFKSIYPALPPIPNLNEASRNASETNNSDVTPQKEPEIVPEVQKPLPQAVAQLKTAHVTQPPSPAQASSTTQEVKPQTQVQAQAHGILSPQLLQHLEHKEQFRQRQLQHQ